MPPRKKVADKSIVDDATNDSVVNASDNSVSTVETETTNTAAGKAKSKAKSKAVGKAKAKAQAQQEVSEESESESEVETPAPKSKSKSKAKAKTAKKAVKEESESEEEAPAPAPKTKAKAKATKKAVKEEESESEEEAPAPKAKGKAKAKTGKTAAKVESESEDEEPAKPAPKAKAKAKTASTSAAAATAAAAAAAAAVVTKDDTVTSGLADKLQKRGTDVKKVHRRTDPYAPTGAVVWHGYDATMNQTNIGNNNNKFYVLQVLQLPGGQYAFFTRWGRVGDRGQMDTKTFSSPDPAINLFKAKFSDKSGSNVWQGTPEATFPGFKAKSGKYSLVLTNHGNEDEEDEEEEALAKRQKLMDAKNEVKDEAADGKDIVKQEPLDPELANLMSLISSREAMQETLRSFNYDSSKLPLGKLSKATIGKAFEALREIEAVIRAIENPTERQGRSVHSLKEDLQELNNQFYSLIPHDVGRSATALRGLMVDSLPKLHVKVDMLDNLLDLKASEDLMQKQRAMEEQQKAKRQDPLRQAYESLGCDLRTLDKNSDEFKLVSEYFVDSRAHQFNKYEVVSAYELTRPDEQERFKPFAKDPNRKLLWHGSRMSNWMGILSQGLRIAPPEAPVTGYMFDKGCYFADRSSKSANYTMFHSRPDGLGVMTLCEVSLGKEKELNGADYKAGRFCLEKDAVFGSVKGCGRIVPDPKGNVKLKDGTIVPKGANVTLDDAVQRSLMYNEFIVYNVARVRMRFCMLVRLK